MHSKRSRVWPEFDYLLFVAAVLLSLFFRQPSRSHEHARAFLYYQLRLLLSLSLSLFPPAAPFLCSVGLAAAAVSAWDLGGGMAAASLTAPPSDSPRLRRRLAMRWAVLPIASDLHDPKAVSSLRSFTNSEVVLLCERWCKLQDVVLLKASCHFSSPASRSPSPQPGHPSLNHIS